MADPLEILKQIALQRAMQNQQPQLASASMGDNGVPQLPQGQAPQVQMQQPNVGAQSPQVQSVQTQPGPIKSFLSQFIYGAGQGLVKHAGLETDAERQQRQLQDQLQQQAGQRAQQTANDMSAYRNAQVGGLQAKADQLDAANQPFIIPNDPSIPSVLRGTQTTVGAWNNTLKPLIVNLGKTDTATIGANSRQDVAQTQAQAAQARAQQIAQAALQRTLISSGTSRANTADRIAATADLFNLKTDAKASTGYQNIVDEADTAHKLAAMGAAGNAPADVDLALSFFKTMKGASGSGIRFTQQEQNLIRGSRNSAGDIEGVAQKVLGGGQMFTPEQRQNIIKVIDTHADAARNHLGSRGSTPASDPANTPASSTDNPFAKYGGVVVKR